MCSVLRDKTEEGKLCDAEPADHCWRSGLSDPACTDIEHGVSICFADAPETQIIHQRLRRFANENCNAGVWNTPRGNQDVSVGQ